MVTTILEGGDGSALNVGVRSVLGRYTQGQLIDLILGYRVSGNSQVNLGALEVLIVQRTRYPSARTQQ